MDESVQAKVGGRVRVRSGQYVITAIVVEDCGDAWMVRNPKSGRVFKVRRIIEVLGDGEASPATIPASVGVPQMERPARESPKRLSLVDAAFEVPQGGGASDERRRDGKARSRTRPLDGTRRQDARPDPLRPHLRGDAPCETPTFQEGIRARPF